ncbi:MAG: carbohydrate kinase family protein, partial [Acidimicrobiales bacterium]
AGPDDAAQRGCPRLSPAGQFGEPRRPGGRALDVVSFGSVFLEVVFGGFDRLPGPGEELFVEPFAFSLGGAVTSATAARQAGAAVGLASVLGDDLGSRLLTEHCARVGVDLSLSETVSGPTAGITVVLNFDGDRAFITHMPSLSPGAPKCEHWARVLEQEQPAWCYLHAGPQVVGLLRRARELGTRVAVDVNLEEVAEFPAVVVECARLAGVFVPNETELVRLTGSPGLEEAISVAASWCPLVVVKRGAKGAVAVEKGVATEVSEGLLDVVVKDRTGAGDAFAGATIASLAKGAGLVEAVGAGNAAGSEAVARLGAAGPLPV